jgi:hypothetical protein
VVALGVRVDGGAATFAALVLEVLGVAALAVVDFADVPGVAAGRADAGCAVVDLGAAAFGEVVRGEAVFAEAVFGAEAGAACLPLGEATEEAFSFGVGVSEVVTSGDPFDDRQCPVRIWANA